MKVKDYEHDMIIGQKFRVEVEYRIQDPDTDMSELWYTYSYEVGKPVRIRFYNDEVDYFRSLDGFIYLHVHRMIDSIDDVIPGYDVPSIL